MKDDGALKRLREAKARFGEELLAHPDIHGVGIGYKRTGGKKTRTLALVVHVYRKRPPEAVEEARRIPSVLSFFSSRENEEVEVPVDVREVPPPTPEVDCPDCGTDFEARIRPVPGGYSIGLTGVAGGTLGGYVWDGDTEQIVFLSNEHVLGSSAGDTVIQPSATDGGSSPADDFGEVVRAGTLDVAIGETDSGEAEIECSGPAVFEIADAELEMAVEKVGQTTGLTCGIVELIDYDSGHYGSHDDLWIDGDGSDFSQGGDSGSLYVEMDPPEDQDWKRVVGIHWGGSVNDGVGHPIRAVFRDLNLTTVCEGVVNALIEAIFGAGEEVEEEGEERDTPAARRAGAPASRCRPGPVVRGGKRGRFHHGIARDFEARLDQSRTGTKALDVLRDRRVDVVQVLSDGDGHRATVAALAPLLCGKVTTDQVLEHRLTASDVDRFREVMRVAARLRPEIEPLLELGKELLAEAEGETLSSLIGLSEARR